MAESLLALTSLFVCLYLIICHSLSQVQLRKGIEKELLTFFFFPLYLFCFRMVGETFSLVSLLCGKIWFG